MRNTFKSQQSEINSNCEQNQFQLNCDSDLKSKLNNSINIIEHNPNISRMIIVDQLKLKNSKVKHFPHLFQTQTETNQSSFLRDNSREIDSPKDCSLIQSSKNINYNFRDCSKVTSDQSVNMSTYSSALNKSNKINILNKQVIGKLKEACKDSIK